MAKQTYNEEYVYGTEPDWSRMLILPSMYQSELGIGLYYYGNTITSAKRKEWAIILLSEGYGYSPDDLKPIPEFYLERIGAIHRMQERGFKMNPQHMRKILEPVPALIEKYKSTPAIIVKPKVKVDVNLSAQLEIIDSTIDKIVSGALIFDEPEILDSLTIPNIKHLICHYKDELDEINAVITRSDLDLVEAYTGIRNDTLQLLYHFYSKVISILDLRIPKTVRKPRKKKVIPKSKQVSKLNYLPKCDILGISSIKPEDLIGKQKLLVFNTNNRQLMFFNSKDGFKMKGSTVLDFDASRSCSKTIRKPEVMLPKLLKSTTVVDSKTFDDIKAVGKPLTGRINKHCILLKVF